MSGLLPIITLREPDRSARTRSRRRAVEAEVLERFLDCGDLHNGFAQIFSDKYGHDYLLAYSCKTRYFCPSCHQNRVLTYGAWLEDDMLAPVPQKCVLH